VRKEPDQNSYYYKYHYDHRPKQEKVEITKDMEDPVIVSKELRLKNPDRADFEKKNKEIELAIDKLRTKMQTLNSKKREMNEGGKVANTQMTRKEFLS
jgi:hypothetical protein